MDILKDFGVEPLLLLAQIINFIILLYILKRFLYKPVLKVLEERKKRIETSMKQADDMQNRFDESAKKQEELLDKGREEAARIVEESKQEARALSTLIQAETKQNIQDSLKKNQESLELEQQKMVAEARSQIVDIIAATTEKVVTKSLEESDRERLIQQSIKDIKR
jgi:F-type H+-transporting ATPase subunit b